VISRVLVPADRSIGSTHHGTSPARSVDPDRGSTARGRGDRRTGADVSDPPQDREAVAQPSCADPVGVESAAVVDDPHPHPAGQRPRRAARDSSRRTPRPSGATPVPSRARPPRRDKSRTGPRPWHGSRAPGPLAGDSWRTVYAARATARAGTAAGSGCAAQISTHTGIISCHAHHVPGSPDDSGVAQAKASCAPTTMPAVTYTRPGRRYPNRIATAEPTNAATDSRIATRPTPPDTSTACAIQAIETTTSFTTIRPNTTKRARSIDPVHVPPEPRATAALGAHASPATRTTSRAPTKRQPRPDYHSTAQSGTAVMSRTAGT